MRCLRAEGDVAAWSHPMRQVTADGGRKIPSWGGDVMESVSKN